MSNKVNILIIKHGSFGDLVRADCLINSIKDFHKNAEITLLTAGIYIPLFIRNSKIHNFIEDNREPIYKINKYINLRSTLKKYTFSIVYDFQNSQRTKIYKNLLLRNTKWITTNRENHPISGINGLKDMLKKNGIPLKKSHTNLTWMFTDIKKIVKEKKIKNKFILIFPGSSKKHLEKRWPFYPEIIEKILKIGCDVVSILGPDEIELENQLPGKVITDISFAELASLINKAHLIISNDTGPVHIAACLEKKGIIIFGPTTSSIRTGLNSKNFLIKEVPSLIELKPSEIFEDFLKFK